MAQTDISMKTIYRALLASTVAWAAAIFCVINLTLAAINPSVAISPSKFPTKTSWEWLRTNSFLKAEQVPDVVLMGSSLMMIPMTCVDADFTRQTLDAVDHPQSMFLQHLLEQRLGKSGISCFNFALPGAMISDDYLIAKSLLTSGRKPKAIVLGLALRDFIDNGVGCAADTPTYQFFRHFTAVDDIHPLSVDTAGAQLEYWQNRLIFLWNKRMELQAIASEKLREKISSLIPATAGDGRALPASLLAEAAPSQEINSNQLAAKEVRKGTFLIPADLKVPFQDNSREYKNRYRTANRQLFERQKAFLDKLLQLTEKAGIVTIIINMPLTPQNMVLMPPGSYALYRETLDSIASKHQIPVLDLNARSDYQRDLFNDTAHMNGSGGRKLAQEICDVICENRLLSRSLAASCRTAQSLAAPAANY